MLDEKHQNGQMFASQEQTEQREEPWGCHPMRVTRDTPDETAHPHMWELTNAVSAES